MTDEEWRSLLILRAAQRVAAWNTALQAVQGMDDQDVVQVRLRRDAAKGALEQLLPPEAQNELCRQRQPRAEPDPMGFRDTAIVIAIATAAAIAIAPLGAWLVKEAIVKELVKSAVSAVFVGAATLAAEHYLHHRQPDARSQAEREIEALLDKQTEVHLRKLQSSEPEPSHPGAQAVRTKRTEASSRPSRPVIRDIGPPPTAEDIEPTVKEPEGRSKHVAIRYPPTGQAPNHEDGTKTAQSVARQTVPFRQELWEEGEERGWTPPESAQELSYDQDANKRDSVSTPHLDVDPGGPSL